METYAIWVLGVLLIATCLVLAYACMANRRWEKVAETYKRLVNEHEEHYGQLADKAALLERNLNTAYARNEGLAEERDDARAEITSIREHIQELETDLENARNESGNLRGVLELERIERENLQGEYESAIREPAMHLAVYVSDTIKDRFGNSRGPVSLMLVMQWSDGPEKWLELRALSYSKANVAKLNKIVDEFNDTLKTQRLAHHETEAAAE